MAFDPENDAVVVLPNAESYTLPSPQEPLVTDSQEQRLSTLFYMVNLLATFAQGLEFYALPGLTGTGVDEINGFRVYRQTTEPASPLLGDIWVSADDVRVFNGAGFVTDIYAIDVLLDALKARLSALESAGYLTPTSTLNAAKVTGVLDPATIPASVKPTPIIATDDSLDPCGIDQISASVQSKIGHGSAVIVEDGRTLYYQGTGDKTDEANYVVGADQSPAISQVIGLQSALDAKQPTISAPEDIGAVATATFTSGLAGRQWRVASKAAAKAISAGILFDGLVISMECRTEPGDGGHGDIVWRAGDQSDLVALDPLEILYFPLNGDDGTNGCWERAHGGIILPGYCGIKRLDRTAAADNGAAIQAAGNLTSWLPCTLMLGRGPIFNSEPIVFTTPVSIVGAGPVSQWSKLMTQYQGRAATEIIMTGTGSKDQKVFGVSSKCKWGGGRINPSARPSTHNDSEYRMSSFVVESASETGRALKAFSAAWYMNRGASGSYLEGFRVLPDYGGDEGYDGYTELYEDSVGIVTYPLSDGNWDVGLLLDNTVGITLDRVQFVGQWRMIGLLGIAHAKETPAGLYNNTFINTAFSGYHGVEIRSYDGAPIDAYTTTTIDVPWADDHPFGADDYNKIAISTAGWPADVQYTFTGMTKVTGGAYDVLRLTGITPDVPTGAKFVFPYAKGGGTSQNRFMGGEIQGFQHPSREPCHIKGLGGITEGAFPYPGGCLFVGGTKTTEIYFQGTSLTGYEEVMMFVDDCRQLSFDGFIEVNRGAGGGSSRSGRIILSPDGDLNTHSLSGFASGGALRTIFIQRGTSNNDGSLDTRPALPFIDATDFASDDGFMESFYLSAPLDPGLNGNASEGQAVIAPANGRAGFGRRTAKPPFSDADPENIDWGIYIDDADGKAKAAADLVPETAGAVEAGNLGLPFGRMVSERFQSFSVTLSDDTKADIPIPSKSGFVFITHNPDGDLPSFGFSGIVFFDVGSSPYTGKIGGGTQLNVVDTDLDGTTGANGNTTLGVKAGTLVIENRTGANATYSLTIVG